MEEKSEKKTRREVMNIVSKATTVAEGQAYPC